MDIETKTLLVIATLAMQGLAVSVSAGTIPAQLPKPDGQPGDATKPVKVYILAGQSNMVGMGDIRGARPPYPNLFLSADPAIIPGAVPIVPVSGGKAQGSLPVARHGVYDAKAAVHSALGDEAVSSCAVALGTVSEKLPATEGTQTVVVTALMDVPANGIYTVHAGFEDSSYNFVTLDGKEVYRKDLNGNPVITKIALETGKRYPIQINYIKSGSAAFWLEQVDIESKGDLVTLTGNLLICWTTPANGPCATTCLTPIPACFLNEPVHCLPPRLTTAKASDPNSASAR